MAEIITVENLASYPGIVLGSTETNTLVVGLVNDSITDIIGALDPVPARVRAIAYEMAARALRNPEGYTSVTKSIDDWSTTVRRDGQGAAGAGVYLEDDEEAYLLGLISGGSRGVGTIRVRVPGYGCQRN